MWARKTPLKRGKSTLTRSGFKPKPSSVRNQTELTVERPRNQGLLLGFDASAFRTATPVSQKVAVAPPKQPRRTNARLRALAEGQQCLLCVPGVCTGNTETTVGCHGNAYKWGKGGSRKSCDAYLVWGCGPCHAWLDQQSMASYEIKQAVFERALAQQYKEYTAMLEHLPATSAVRQPISWAMAIYQIDETESFLITHGATFTFSAGLPSSYLMHTTE